MSILNPFSFMIVFRVLCGEWIESMWDCIWVAGFSCIPYFLASVLVANLVILNLFLALLLSSFSDMGGNEATDEEPDKMQIAGQRISRFKAWLGRTLHPRNLMRLCKRKKISDKPMPITLNGNGVNHNKHHHGNSNGFTSSNGYPEKSGGSILPFDTTKPPGMTTDEDYHLQNGGGNGGVKEDMMNNFHSKIGQDMDLNIPPYQKATFSNGGVTNAETIDANDDDAGSFQYPVVNEESDPLDEKFHEEVFYYPVDEVIVEDCCPAVVYRKMPCCLGDSSPFWQVWNRHRLLGSKLIENKYFEGIVLTLILISSFVMTLEDIWFETKPTLIDCLYYLDRILTVVFFLETTLKLFAMGFVVYFSNAWCWLDFVIVAVSLINFGASLLGAGNIPIFKTMRTLRALRPLRAMAKMEGMKVVVNALIGALPSIVNVLLVCLIFWLIFAIIGVNTFMGKFYKCMNLDTGIKYSHEIIPNKTVCEEEQLRGEPAEWRNAWVTFDNVGMAYLALLQIATWKGWIDVMNDAIDSVDQNKQPHREVNIYMYMYFVFFIVFGSFFTLNLLVGVIIDKFNEQKNKGGSSLDAFMTEDQKKYINAMKKASTKKPVKSLPRPFWKPQAIIFAVVTNKKFDMIIMAFIGMNMVTMMCDHYQQSPQWTMALDNLNLFFIIIFSSETVLKIFALRQHFFTDAWNLFDFIVVVLSLGGLFLSDLIEKYFVSPTLLRVVCAII
jgi:voltage-gated sodium channel type II alpha